MNGDDSAFWRKVLIIAGLHVLALALIGGIAAWWNRPEKTETIAWLDGGGMPAAGTQAEEQPSPEAAETPEEQTEEPAATPEKSKPMVRDDSQPSEIVLPTPTPEPTIEPTPEPTAAPEPTAKPTPKPTPRPTSRPTPKSTPKASPKASPKSSPKHKPKALASPKKSTSKASPKASPKKTPKEEDDQGDDSPKTSAAKEAFKAASHTAAAGGEGDEGTAPGTGGGHRGGKGHAGGGDTESDFGWYHSMLHDRFYSRWVQPTSIVTATAKFTATVKIRIEKDGSISDVSLAASSGNDIMDQSVMDAARRVTQVDPLPEGLGHGGAYEVKINFELSQDNQ